MTALRAAVLTLAADRLLRAAAPGGEARWDRTNYRGARVTLLAGPALTLSATAAAALPPAARVVAGLGAGAVGAYDDLAGPDAVRSRGFRGHAAALRRGTVTSGAVKTVGIITAGLCAAALRPEARTTPQVLLDGAVIAGSANLVNLLDLRPGRALKVGIAAALALRQPGIAAAAAVLLPADLGERAMLGDAGANALGALLGLGLLERVGGRGRAAALGVLVALTAASEVVSFSRVIDATPPLRRLDQLGRRR